MELEFEFDPKKNTWLNAERGIDSEEIIACIMEEGVVQVIPHHKPQEYPDQFVYVLELDDYVWLVPAEKRGKTIRLITAYPSRKATKQKKGMSYEKEER